jgi:hypothetical protein
MRLASFIAVASVPADGARPAHDLEQLHHVRRAEEVQAEHVVRPRGRAGNQVDVERRGVGREDRARLGDVVELGEHFTLDRHVLEHGLDDEIGGGRVASDVVVPTRPILRSTSSGLSFLPPDRIASTARSERLRIRVHERHRNARVGERDSRSRAPSCPRRSRRRCSIARVGVDSGTSATRDAARSAKNAWRKRLRLGRAHQFQELAALEAHARIERHRHRRRDGVDARERRRQSLRSRPRPGFART